MALKLSIVILNYNVQHFLTLCIKSVQAAVNNLNAEIIVVDNNSTDGSVQMLQTQFPDVICIENKENYGFSKGNNIGVKQAKGEYLCILNPDTIVAEDTFAKLINFVEKQNNIGIVGCQLIDGNGKFLPESKRNIPIPNVALKKLLGYSSSYYANQLQTNEVGKVSVLPGAFMFLKRQIYNKVGGFDEDYFMYGEDIDLSYRLLKAGYQNYYYGPAQIIHFKGESTLKNKQYAERFFKAMHIFYHKHFKTNILLNIAVVNTTRLGAFFSVKPKALSYNFEAHVIISNTKLEQLESVLKLPVSYTNEISSYKNNTIYILDNNYLSFKTIIKIISNKPNDCSAGFRILPQSEFFIVGSDSNTHRGQTICF